MTHPRHHAAADLGTDGATSSDPLECGCGQPGLTHRGAHPQPCTSGPWELAKLCTLKASSKAVGFIVEWHGGLRRELAATFPEQHATERSLRKLLEHRSPASHTEPCCVVGAGSCSPLQRAARGAAAALTEHGQPAVPCHPFPPPCSNKATPKIRAPAAPPAPCPGPKETHPPPRGSGHC